MHYRRLPAARRSVGSMAAVWGIDTWPAAAVAFATSAEACVGTINGPAATTHARRVGKPKRTIASRRVARECGARGRVGRVIARVCR